MYGIDTFPMVIGGLFAGFLFGFLLQKGQVAKYAVIVGQFLLVDHTVVKVMGTAVVVGAVGVYGMLQLGWIEGLHVKPALLLGVATGGVLFGAGMSTLGYCPGTGVAAAGSGSRHAWWGVLGMIVGAAVYAESYPALDAGFLKVWDLGKVTLSDVTGVSPWVFILAIAVGAVAFFVWLTRWERQHPAT